MDEDKASRENYRGVQGRPADDDNDRFWYCMTCRRAYHAGHRLLTVDCPDGHGGMIRLDELVDWVRETPILTSKLSDGRLVAKPLTGWDGGVDKAHGQLASIRVNH